MASSSKAESSLESWITIQHTASKAALLFGIGYKREEQLQPSKEEWGHDPVGRERKAWQKAQFASKVLHLLAQIF